MRGTLLRMGIFDRMGRIISSNVNSLLDRAEDPKKSVDLLLGEMKEQIRAAKKEIVENVAAQKTLGKKVEEFDSEVAKWERRAELALKADDEKLAREALVQKNRVVGERDRAEAMRAEQRAAVLAMKAELERMEQRAGELEARKGTLVAQVEQARGGGGAEGLGAGPGGRAFDEFRRMEAEIDGKAAEVEAHREVEDALRDGRANPRELEAKFAALERGESPDGKGSAPVDDELAALKKKLRIG